jgi:hypothetical protein
MIIPNSSERVWLTDPVYDRAELTLLNRLHKFSAPTAKEFSERTIKQLRTWARAIEEVAKLTE